MLLRSADLVGKLRMTLVRLTGPHWCKETEPRSGPSSKETGPRPGPSSKETGPHVKEETLGPAWLAQYSPSLPKVALVPDQATGETVD